MTSNSSCWTGLLEAWGMSVLFKDTLQWPDGFSISVAGREALLLSKVFLIEDYERGRRHYRRWIWDHKSVLFLDLQFQCKDWVRSSQLFAYRKDLLIGDLVHWNDVVVSLVAGGLFATLTILASLFSPPLSKSSLLCPPPGLHICRWNRLSRAGLKRSGRPHFHHAVCRHTSSSSCRRATVCGVWLPWLWAAVLKELLRGLRHPVQYRWRAERLLWRRGWRRS